MLRFHTSKFEITSTATQTVEENASKRMMCERAVRASDPAADQRTKVPMRICVRHQRERRRCWGVMLAMHSRKVGRGRDAGRERGARGGGSWMIE